MERKLIAVAVSSALVVPMAAQAVEFSVYGHVNRAIISVDGGGPTGEADTEDGSLQHVDADSSGSRFGFEGSEELDSGVTAGVNLEYSLDPSVRHAYVSLSTAGGKISLGHTETASDGMAFARLGGPSWLGGVSNSCTYHASDGPACRDNNGDRREILRYDTPGIGPAAISLSSGDDDYLDAMVSIAGSFGDAGYDVRLGHITEYETGGEDMGDITTASAAVSFGQGTSAAAAWSQENIGDESEYMYVELDHSYGDGSIGVYYKTGEYGAGDNKGVDGSLWGVGVGHSLGRGVTAYAGYRQISEDGMKDIDLVVAGMRVKFE